jgi:hypothetical protein
MQPPICKYCDYGILAAILTQAKRSTNERIEWKKELGLTIQKDDEDKGSMTLQLQ